jgi:DNA helicase-2/ATP-dependent DNA helicase PcrA
VIAGAGSGKTRTLTYRVAYLVEQGVAPEQILLLTFTNKASKEMLARVASLLPHDLSRLLWGGTFHHVGNRILRRHADRVGYAKDYTILDREDAEDLISASLGEAGVDPKDKRLPEAGGAGGDLQPGCRPSHDVSRTTLKKQFGYFTELESWISKVAEIYLRRKRDSARRWITTTC